MKKDDHVFLDKFYSGDEIATMQRILGNELHYHNGWFHEEEDLETGQRNTVRAFYPEIPLGATVLDAGCGWGGPANMLVKERVCHLQGVTISSRQAAYCQSLGLEVKRLDLENEAITGAYDVAFMLEVLSHIRDKPAMLAKLRRCASRLVLSVNCISSKLSDVDARRQTFGGSMVFCTESELEEMVTAAGWTIRTRRNRRLQSMRTNVLWRDRLIHHFGDEPLTGHLASLRGLVENATKSPLAWCANHPLIDIVAD